MKNLLVKFLIFIDKHICHFIDDKDIYPNEKIIILKPQKYINLSGEVVKKFVDYYKIDISDILIINDDLDLPVGCYKLKPSGGSAGHNGLKNIEKENFRKF